jgi:tetratricopeptide (TPR) repeat protein
MHFLAFGQWKTERIQTIGRNALYFEDYVLSIQYFNQVIKIKPYLAEPYMYRAMAKIQLGDDIGAELDATEAIERNPFLPEAYYVRGYARRKATNYTEAIKDFSTAYDFSPNSLNLLLNRMDTYMRLEKYNEAMNDLNTYIRQSPKNKQLLYEKGVIYLFMKDTVNAEKSFADYAKSDSTNAQAWSALALLKLQKNNIEELWPLFSELGYPQNDIRKLNHTGTHPMHTELTIPFAIEFYNKIGPSRKEERLRFLAQYWTNKLSNNKKVIINTPISPERSCGIANVGIQGMKPSLMAETLLKKYQIWTVAIDGAGVHGCRITPNVYTTTIELDRLVLAVNEMAV